MTHHLVFFGGAPKTQFAPFVSMKTRVFRSRVPMLLQTHTHTQTQIFFVVSGYSFQIGPHFSNTISPQMPELPVEMLGFQQFPNIQFREAWFRTGAPSLH